MGKGLCVTGDRLMVQFHAINLARSCNSRVYYQEGEDNFRRAFGRTMSSVLGHACRVDMPSRLAKWPRRRQHHVQKKNNSSIAQRAQAAEARTCR
eukprot:6359172-Amphidinium_carterae.1